MRFYLRPGLTFCIVGDCVVFLDIVSGRYFALASPHVPTFRRWADGFLPSPECPTSQGDFESLDRLEQQGILTSQDQSGQPGYLSAADLPSPETALETGHGRPGIARIVVALWLQLLWSWRVRHWSMERMVCQLGRSRRPFGNAAPRSAGTALGTIVRSFDVADAILGSHDRCLTRSLALAGACRSHGLPSTLVIGVRPAPFAAHCWVQLGDRILNETPDQAQLFTPILAV